MPVFETISQLLRKEGGVAVQKQTVDLLYLLLNCNFTSLSHFDPKRIFMK